MANLCIMTFYSTHHVLKGEKVLLENGIDVKVIPMPREFSSNCGIALSLAWEDSKAASHAFINVGLQPEGIHQMKKE